MESAIQSIVKVYLKSAKGRDDLGAGDFQKLVKCQLSNILTDTDSKKAVAEMREGLDADRDGRVGFKEYMKLVGYLAESLSQQRMLEQEQTTQKPVAEQVNENALAAGKEEAKPEAQPECKTEEVTPPEATKEETPAAAPAVAAAPAAVATPTPAEPAAPVEAAAAVVAAAEEAKEEVKVEVKEEAKVEEAEKVEEAKENVTPAAEEDGEKKTEEETS